jgi:hypothetical protein
MYEAKTACAFFNNWVTSSNCYNANNSSYLTSGGLDNGLASVYQNGVLVTKSYHLANIAPNGLRIGSYNNSEWSNAAFSELLWYSRPLPDNIRKAVEAYLNARYSLW